MATKIKQFVISFSLLFLSVLFCCSQSGTELKIMTFNIRYGTASDGDNSWEHRKSILIATLKKHQPDILGTQESLDFQIEVINAAFPQWKVFGVGRYHGIELSDRPHESMSGESCKIFYDTTKFMLIEEGTFWHSDTPEIPGSMSWGNTLPRVTTWGVFQIKYRDKKFVIMNTHYHWDEPYITNASKLLIKKWIEISKNLPTILMGDFNLPPSSNTHKLFCEKIDSTGFKTSFIDLWSSLGKTESNAGTFNDFKGDKNGDRIDWILATPQFHVTDIQIIQDQINNKYPSDHFPVLTIVRL